MKKSLHQFVRLSLLGMSLVFLLQSGTVTAKTFQKKSPLTAIEDSISVNNISAFQVFQRDKTGHADIFISGNYTGFPTAIEVSFNDSEYQVLDQSPLNGMFSGTLYDVSGQGTLITRFANDPSVLTEIQHVGVGDIFIIAGQSNASGRGANLNNYEHPTLKAGLFGNDDNWKELEDDVDSHVGQIDLVSRDFAANGSPWPLVATQIMAEQNIPVAFIPAPFSGSTTKQWEPSKETDTLYGSMRRRIIATGSQVKGMLWFQGESDVFFETSPEVYKKELSSIVDTLAGEFNDIPTMVGQIASLPLEGIDIIRQAQVDLATDNKNTLLGPATYDINLSDEDGDSLHFKSDADMQRFADRWAAAINKEFYSADDGYGPIVENITYQESANKIVVSFTDDSLPVLDLDSTVLPSSFVLMNGDTEVAIDTVTIVNDTVELLPAVVLDTNQTITLSYASFNRGVDAALYDNSDLPAQPFYNQDVTLIPTFGVNLVSSFSL